MRHGHFLALGLILGLGVSVATAGNRPTADNGFLMLNGEQTRDLNVTVADGGGLTLVTLDAGVGCNLVATGAVYEMHCNAAGYFCAWGDGGCSSAISSQAYGRPVNASTPTAPAPFFFMTQTDTTNATKQVCITPASGTVNMICAPFRLR